MTALVFDVQRFSLHDGPGIRTVVFFKGCPLRCLWCHNPESQRGAPELMFYREKCTGCGACAKRCALAFTPGCRRCGACAGACARGAREQTGREAEVSDLIAEALRDVPFYRTSGGGVTLSGGEPLMQSSAAAAILAGCKAAGVHTALETSGFADWRAFEAVLPVTDLFLFDLKGMDEDTHVKNTGVSNRAIIENARSLAAAGAEIRFRMPYVPGMNADEAPAAAAFAKSLGKDLELMAYHNIGVGKYAALGRTYACADLLPPAEEEMRLAATRLGALYDPAGI